jgi:hypothetical protein
MLCISAFVSLANVKQYLDTMHPDLFRGGKAARRKAGKDFPDIIKYFSVCFGIERTQDITVFDQASFDGPFMGWRMVSCPTK